MKKILILIISSFISISYLNAEEVTCTYSKKKELNTLSIYVDTTYQYKGNNTFDLTINNLTNELLVERDNQVLEGNTITSLEEGSNIKLTIKATNNECSGETLRIINISIPYVNPYYGSNSCIGNESLNVCSSEFLDYKLSETTFNNLIKKANDEKNKIDKPTSDEEDITTEETFKDKVIKLIKKIYIPVGLILISTFIPMMIFSPIYRKIKHGL